MQDRLRRQDKEDREQDMQNKKDNRRIDDANLPHGELTSLILRCCFDVMNELGTGFLEAVYKNALIITLQEKGLQVDSEKIFDVYFREQKIGVYKADLVVENVVIVELKCCRNLLPEHQAQIINYLKAANLPIGLLVNFQNRKVEYKRLYHPSLNLVDADDPVPYSFYPAHPVT